MNTPLPSKLAAPAKRALDGANISSLEDLGRYTEKEIRDLHGMGPKAMRALKEAMETVNLEFMA